MHAYVVCCVSVRVRCVVCVTAPAHLYRNVTCACTGLINMRSESGVAALLMEDTVKAEEINRDVAFKTLAEAAAEAARAEAGLY